LLFSSTAFAQVGEIFVDQNATTGANTGDSWADAFLDLQDGIDAAEGQSGDFNHVLVAHGTYNAPTVRFPNGSTDARGFSYVMLDQVHLHGGFLGGAGGSTNYHNPDGSFSETIISGARATGAGFYHVVGLDDSFMGNTVIDGFHILGGDATGDPDFQDRDSDRGGGIYCEGSELRLENVTVRENHATYGGGIRVKAPTQGTRNFGVKSSVITLNQATRGAGMFVEQISTEVHLCNVRFDNNGSVENTTHGGGLYTDFFTTLKASNCLFTNNKADIAGAGIYSVTNSQAGQVDDHEWRHCTIANNYLDTVPIVPEAAQLGAGIHYEGSGQDVQYLGNSIVYGNVGGQDAYAFPAGTLAYEYSDIGRVVGGTSLTGNISMNPLFVNAAGGDFRLKLPGPLLPGSPCLDTASDTSIGLDFLDLNDNKNYNDSLPFDLEMRARLIDVPNVGGSDTADMGAYETPNG